MNTKTILCSLLFFSIQGLSHTLADDASDGISAMWDISSLKKEVISISVKNAGKQPVQFKDVLFLQYVEQGENLENILKRNIAAGKDFITPVVVFVSNKESSLEKHQSSGSHIEAAVQIAPGSSKTFALDFDEDFAQSFIDADEIFLVLIRDGKILQTETMKKQNGVWKEEK